MALHIYDPKDVVLIHDGTQVSGFADGTFVTVEFNEDFYTLQMGTDGDGTRSKSNNFSGRFTFTLMQSSLSNDDLLVKMNADLNADTSKSTSVTIPSQGRDGKALVFSAEGSWIVKYPNSELGREATSREWIIETNELKVEYQPVA